MGFVQPTPIQAATIPVALLGRDVCACAATGTGKTAAFMLPVLERLLYKPKQAPITRVLVLTPTRELAVQIHQVSRQLAQHTNVEISLSAGSQARFIHRLIHKIISFQVLCFDAFLQNDWSQKDSWTNDYNYIYRDATLPLFKGIPIFSTPA